MVSGENIQTVDKSKTLKTDEIEEHNMQNARGNQEKMGLGDLIDELIAIPSGVYQNEGLQARRKLLKEELNKRGKLLVNSIKKDKK